jgi:hypothetical protein
MQIVARDFRVCEQLFTVFDLVKVGKRMKTLFSPRFINLQIDLALVYYNAHVFQTNRNNENINFLSKALHGSG